MFVGGLGEQQDGRSPGVGNGDAGIWSVRNGGDLELVVRDRDQVPGLSEGTLFFEVGEPQINSEGRVAFVASVAVDRFAYPFASYDDYFVGDGLWAEGNEGVVTLIVRVGQQIDVNDDPLVEDIRMIRKLGVEPYRVDYGPPSFVFNDQGEIAFWAEFTDGTSGIFVSRLVAVPEPATGLLALMAGVGLATRRRVVVLS